MEKTKIIIKDNAHPQKHEVLMAKILQSHFNANVIFIKPVNAYKVNSPDIIMNNLLWEMKAPKTNKMSRFARDVRDATKQSNCVIISSQRTKIRDENICRFLINFVRLSKKVNKLIFIDSKQKVLTIL